MALPPQHLWGEVGRRPTEALRLVSDIDAHFAQSKISDEGVAIRIEHNIVGFQISEDNIPLV